jgi:hypothetical protein
LDRPFDGRQTSKGELRVRFADGKKGAHCCCMECLLVSIEGARLTLNDIVHQDQNMLAFTSDPIVYAVKSMLAALKHISADSGYADGSARRYGLCRIILNSADSY